MEFTIDVMFKAHIEPAVFTPQLTTDVTLWAILILYAFTRFLPLFPDQVPMLVTIALTVIPPAIFALLQGGIYFGLKGTFIFSGLCLLTGASFELLSLRTGFPFGHYYFTPVMGPQIGGLPLLLALAYVGMAYLAWSLSGIILGSRASTTITVPLLAAFLLVAWDLSMEPVWATVVRAWIWTGGGPYFGVPLTNFWGWLLTVYVFFQLFAVYLKCLSEAKIKNRHCPMLPLHARQSIVFYALAAGGNLLLWIPQRPALVMDATGTSWSVSSILTATTLVSLFTMGAFALIAWLRLRESAPRCLLNL